jgi:endonuclease/exonuclease/phosphatase family metal-dependent hydrolase
VYELQQDRLIGAAGAGQYDTHRAWAGRPEYGNSLLVREPFEAAEVDRLELSHGRSALRGIVSLPGGASLLVVVTHLHHEVEAAAERDAQAAILLDWIDGSPPADAVVAMGDFNADPLEPAYARMQAAGFRSAYAEANGAEPAVTWPSGIIAPAMDTDGEPGCLDYIWLRGAARPVAARLAWDRPAVDDPTLYPSDHLGISATVEVG